MITKRAAKAKGRAHQYYVAEQFQKYYQLGPHDVISTPASVPGVDLWLSPLAKQKIVFDVEAKRQEKLNIWQALEQSKSNCVTPRVPMLVFRRSNDIAWACVPFETLLELLTK